MIHGLICKLERLGLAAAVVGREDEAFLVKGGRIVEIAPSWGVDIAVRA